MTQNINVLRPPFLPTVPLPVGMVGGGMMYMYSCSQCDFKTHIEAMFKQHVDSVHLGITTVSAAGGNSIILSNNVIASTAGAAGVQVSPVTISGGSSAQVTAQPGQHTMLVTGVKSAAPGVVTLSPTQVQVTQPQTLTTMAVAGTSAATLAGQPTTAAVTTVVHKCPKCGFLAPSKNQLTQHKKKFHGKQPTAGGVTYAGAAATAAAPAPVSAAAAAAASGKKTFNCSTCGYTTTRRDGLSQHYDSVHLKIKNHQCSLCPYAASQKGTLNRHVKLRHKKKDDLLLGQ